MIEEVNNFWDSILEGCEPEAHNLKHLFKTRWVRFHSLPQSKRYPENEQEYQEVFSRYNKILRELSPNSSEIIIILSEYSESLKPKKPENYLDELFPDSICWRTVKDSEEDDLYWHTHTKKIKYTGMELNELLRLVANDKARNVIIICIETQSVFHPYDGGMDVILTSTIARDNLKAKYKNWLSSHPDGF
jgi:hypothetical protein